MLKDIHLAGEAGGYFIVFKGLDDEHGIEDVRFENCTINGRQLDASYPNLQIGTFAEDIRFVSGPANSTS